MKSDNFSDTELKESTMNDILTGYQDVLQIQQDLLNKTNSDDIRFVSLIAEVIIDAKTTIDIDERVIDKCLNFIKSFQNNDGTFVYNHEKSFRKEMGGRQSQNIIHTAQILVAFLKDELVRQKYRDVIQKSISFLKSNEEILKYDYEKVLAAYVYSLNGEGTLAQQKLNSMKNNYLMSQYLFHYSLFLEVVSYKISTLINININNTKNEKDLQDTVHWVIENRVLNYERFSPFDTVLALEALYEYSKKNGLKDPNIIVNFEGQKKSINKHNEEILEKFSSAKNFKVTGNGLVYGINYKTLPDENSSDNLDRNFTVILSINCLPNTKQISIDVEISLKTNDKNFKGTNLIIAEVKLPTGYQILEHQDINAIVS